MGFAPILRGRRHPETTAAAVPARQWAGQEGGGEKTGARIMDSHGKSCNIQQHPRF